MNRPIWIKYILIALVATMFLSLAACDQENHDKPSLTETKIETEDPTESLTDESETESDTDTDTESEPDTDAETEEITDNIDVDLDSIIYENGADIQGSGHLLEEDAFALVARTFDRAIAIEKTADEIKAMLADKTSMTEGAVYLVKEPIVLDSNTVYYGNLGAIIAEGGIVIKDAEEVLIKELMVDGNITVENSTGIIIFRLCLTSEGVAINVSEDCYDVAVKGCRINATETALAMGANLSTVYQNYFCSKNGIISTGDDMAVQSNIIIATSLGISSTGAYCTVKNNSIETASDGTAIKFVDSENGLIALNTLAGAQLSVDISDSFNCSVILNSAIRLSGKGVTNLYFIDNKLGGAIELENNNYLVCDGNTFADDQKPHPIVNLNNENYNGDGMHNVNARLEFGADEDLLPHTNKDLFISMERRSTVRDISVPKNYTFNAYVRNMAKNDSVVIIPPGAYSVNTTLNIQGNHSNTTLYAYGVYQEATQYIPTVDISSASNVTVKGLTIGYSQQSAGQIQVLQKLKNNQLLVISSAGFTEEFGQLNLDKFADGGYFFHPGSYTSWTEIGSWGSYKVIPNPDGSLINEDGTFTIQLGGKDAAKYFTVIEKGEIFTCRLAGSNSKTVAITSSKNILFKDTVTYSYAAALCFNISGAGTEGVELYRHHNLAHSAYEIDKETYDKYVSLEEKYGVDLEVYQDELGRYRGATPRIGSVDATHIHNAAQGLSATSTLFENACDDASNQRGNSSRLCDVINKGDGTVTLLYMDYLPETYLSIYKREGRTEVNPDCQTKPFVAGDRIFVYASNGKIFCDAKVLSSSAEYKKDVVVYEEEYKNSAGKDTKLVWKTTIYSVTVKESDVDMSALEGYNLNIATPDMKNKVIVDNLSRNSTSFTFDNCMVRHNRGRIVIKTRDAVITNCTFKDTSYAGIVISVESTWGESTVAQNVTITKCIFDGTSQTLNSQNNTKFAAIAIEGLGSAGKEAIISADTIPCKNITISGNVFKNVPNNYYITVAAAQGVTISNNTFEARSNESAKKVGKAIYINGCMNVDISNNAYSEFAGGDMTKVIVGNNYKGLKGTDVEGVFEKDKLPEQETEAQ